jgi:hypothetical protein
MSDESRPDPRARAGAPPAGNSDNGDGNGELNGPEEQTRPDGPTTTTTVAAAPTAVTRQAAPGRRRRLVLALVLLVVGTAAVAGVVFLSGDYREEREFKKQTEAIMELLRDGKTQKVYDDASARFQQTLLIDKFLDLIERMNATMGPFVRAGEVHALDQAASVAGMTARISLELEFENGTTMGQLSFHRGKDGVWRLLGMSVDIPADQREKADALAAQESRLRAPHEVEELVHDILQGVREGRAAEVHEGASPVFKGSVTLDEFRNVLQSHQAELGNFVRVLAILSSAQNPDRDQARVQALLEYEKGKPTGTFEFMRVGSSWRLLSFKVVIPFGNAVPSERPL